MAPATASAAHGIAQGRTGAAGEPRRPIAGSRASGVSGRNAQRARCRGTRRLDALPPGRTELRPDCGRAWPAAGNGEDPPPSRARTAARGPHRKNDAMRDKPLSCDQAEALMAESCTAPELAAHLAECDRCLDAFLDRGFSRPPSVSVPAGFAARTVLRIERDHRRGELRVSC